MTGAVTGQGLSVRRMTKRYGSTTALNAVDLELPAGTVVGLLGENGAGKSTLVKIIAGATAPDEGTISLAGREVTFADPRDAIRAGVVHIAQELAYAPDLTVAENIVLGAWPKRSLLVSKRAMRARAEQQLERLSARIPLRTTMRQLGLAERQLVEIAKALSRQARVLLLDEPTAALSAVDSAHLYAVTRRLADAGVCIAFITHRMDEVLAHSDRVVVLRNGSKTLEKATAEATEAEIVEAMVGHVPVRRHAGLGTDGAGRRLRASARVKGMCAEGVEIEVPPREVVGMFGARGSGCEAIIAALGGASREASGWIELDGKRHDLFRTPAQARRHGVLFVPAERKTGGLVMTQTIRFNIELLSLRRLSKLRVMRARRGRALSEEWVRRLNVRCRSVSQNVRELSGGNQQKVLLASRLVVQPSSLLLLHEPTRGVDVAARAEIHQLIKETAAAGTAVLLASSDVEECVNVCDRLNVVRDGRLVAELAGSERTQHAALALATGQAA